MPQGLLSHSETLPYFQILDRNRIRMSIYRRFINRLSSKSFVIRLLVCLFGIYLLIGYLLSDSIDIDNRYVNSVPDVVLEKRLDFQSMALDKLCSPSTSICYTVRDVNEALGVQRVLIVDGFEDAYDTVKYLIPPKGATFADSDTRIWEVDHLKIDSQYTAIMFMAPFLLSTLSVEEDNKDKHVVEIGLGGGSLFMALVTHKPKINITSLELDQTVVDLARKWFGVVENGHQKIMREDGLEYLSDMVKSEKTADVIVVDACDTNKAVPCPVSTFLTPDSIGLLRSAVAPRGCLVVNILAFEEREENTRKVIKMISEAFDTCISVETAEELNVVLVCMPYSVGDIASQMTFYSSRVNFLKKQLGLDYLHEVTIKKSRQF